MRKVCDGQSHLPARKAYPHPAAALVALSANGRTARYRPLLLSRRVSYHVDSILHIVFTYKIAARIVLEGGLPIRQLYAQDVEHRTRRMTGL